MTTEAQLANAGIASSHKLVGRRVVNPRGEYLGRIEDVMLDAAEGRVAYVVLSFGGFLGIGNKLFAYPWSAFQIHETEPHVILDVTKETLEAGPGFRKEQWPGKDDRVWGAGIHSHYKTAPYWH